MVCIVAQVNYICQHFFLKKNKKIKKVAKHILLPIYNYKGLDSKEDSIEYFSISPQKKAVFLTA